MKQHTIILTAFIFILLNRCAVPKEMDSCQERSTKLQDSLAFMLCEIYGSDQGIRDRKLLSKPGLRALEITPYYDSINFYKVLDFVKTNGFPTEKLLGKENYKHECVQAACFAVLLHTPHMLVHNREYLDVFLKEVDKGNMKMDALLIILDKYYVMRRDDFGNRMLLYGSQFGKPCKRYKHKSDSVRALIGLTPLPETEFVECKAK
jgi:hypothetical protein